MAPPSFVDPSAAVTPTIGGTNWPTMPPMAPLGDYAWIDMAYMRDYVTDTSFATEFVHDVAIVFAVSDGDVAGSGSILAWGRDLTISRPTTIPHAIATMKQNKSWVPPAWGADNWETRTILLNPLARIAILTCRPPKGEVDAWFQALVTHPDPVGLAAFYLGTPKL